MIRLAYRLTISIVLVALSTVVFAKDPDCTHPDAWPGGMAFTHLKNAGVIDNDVIDFTKTKISRLASEKIGKDLYRQVHLVHFFKTSGEQVLAITVNEVSSQECSMSNVDVYLVSRRLGDYSEKK